MNYTKSVEKWGVFEFCSENHRWQPVSGAQYHCAIWQLRTQDRQWFYDGNGIYKVRFMPSFEEEYHFTVCGNFSDRKYEGTFLSRRRRKIITAA